MITVLLQGVPRWACWKRKVSKHSELIRSCKLNDNKVQENHSSYQECSCPFRMLWKRIGVLRECCQMYERWRAHTNSLKSAIRACRQHCNLKKCPWEPDIFLKPVSSVFEMTWLGLPQTATKHLARDLWGNLYLGTADDGRAAVPSSNPSLHGTYFFFNIPL